MKHILWFLVATAIAASCGQSYEEQKELSRQERKRMAREDSAALKVAVMPTLDCLPLYVARMYNLFGTLGADVRLKPYTAMMDCDTALAGKRVEGAVTDVVRACRIEGEGVALDYVAATNAYWLLITNRNARIKQLKQLDDKMVAMTRHSATDLLAELAVDSAKLQPERVFRIQVNDVHVRMQMLRNNEMDAMLLTEPQATAALAEKHAVLMDSRKVDFRPGAIVFRSEVVKDSTRRKQMDVFIKAYNIACDSINKNGVGKYRSLIAQYCGVKENVVDSLPVGIKFAHAAPPRQADKDRAAKWLAKKLREDYDNGEE